MKKTILIVLFAMVAVIFGIIYAYGPNPGADYRRSSISSFKMPQFLEAEC